MAGLRSRPCRTCLLRKQGVKDCLSGEKKKETRDRNPVIDERREWRWKERLSGSLQSASICLNCHGANEFVGHSPGRSAEVSAAPACRSVGAEPALKLGFKNLRFRFARGSKSPHKKEREPVNHLNGSATHPQRVLVLPSRGRCRVLYPYHTFKNIWNQQAEMKNITSH